MQRKTVVLSASCFVFAEPLPVISLPAPTAVGCGVGEAPPFANIEIFGDSISSIGNVFHASNGTVPASPYFDGRYSDGRVWTEYLAQYFGISLGVEHDHAWGGATTNNSFIPSYSTFLNASVPSVTEQVATFISTSYNNSTARRTLFSIFSGYNDYWWYVHKKGSLNPSDLTHAFDVVTTDIVSNMKLLYDNGGRTCLVANAVNMSAWPDAATNTREELEAYDFLVRGHNAMLPEKIHRFQRSHRRARIFQFDVFSIMQGIADSPSCFGITNVRDACLDGTTPCKDQFGHQFWDSFHPTTATHKMLSESAVSLLRENSFNVETVSSAKRSRSLD